MVGKIVQMALKNNKTHSERMVCIWMSRIVHLKKNQCCRKFKDCPHWIFTVLESAEVFKYLSGERATNSFEKFR